VLLEALRFVAEPGRFIIPSWSPYHHPIAPSTFPGGQSYRQALQLAPLAAENSRATMSSFPLRSCFVGSIS